MWRRSSKFALEMDFEFMSTSVEEKQMGQKNPENKRAILSLDHV